MSSEMLLRWVLSGILGLSFTWIVFLRYDREMGTDAGESDGQKYLPYVPGNLLPIFLLMLTVWSGVELGLSGAARVTLSVCFGLFIQISVYYVLLVLLLPLLRRVISARACAMLWLIPNYLYAVSYRAMGLSEPKVVVCAPGNRVWILFGVWLAGFGAVLIWKTAGHLLFRRRILKNARPVTDPELLAIWDRVIAEAGIKSPKFRLVCSPDVGSPLSVGLYRRKIRVVLPRQDYSSREAELILRHEIIHIAREDSWSKFFLVFCTALCWFNPLMWMAMRKSADDMELSCDETVLLHADDGERKQYASLILDAAGDERGFTTCLSASAKAMRYRLKNITKPSRRRSGAIVVGLAFVALCMTSGYVALAYGGERGADVLFPSGDPDQYVLRYVTKREDSFGTEFGIRDREGFSEYLSSMTLYEITGNYSFSGGDGLYFRLDGPGESRGIELRDHSIKVVSFSGEVTAEWYYIPDGVDWDRLGDVIVAYPAMNVCLYQAGNPYGKTISAGLDMVWEEENGAYVPVFDGGVGDDDYGVFGSMQYEKAEFSFSQALAEPCSVLVESWDRSGGYTVRQEDMGTPFVLEMPEYPAHYTVCASFRDRNGTIRQARFRFNIGGLEEP